MRPRQWMKLLVGCWLAIACGVAAAPVPAPSTADWRTAVRQFAKGHFKNPAWGYSHSERDYALARSLAASDHVALDDDVLFAASYLHDLAAFPPYGGDEPPDHSDVGADVDPNGGDPDGSKAVKMLEDNVRQVPSRVVSPAGRAMVARRQSESARFLKELSDESEDFRTL